MPLQCYAWSRSLRAITKRLLYAVLLLMGPSVTIPANNTWHACGTAPWRVGPTPLFSLQNVKDSRLRAYVLAQFWPSFLDDVVAQLLILPLWGQRGGVRGDRTVLRDWLLFLRLVGVYVS